MLFLTNFDENRKFFHQPFRKKKTLWWLYTLD
jgi:hypothetical protein